MRSIIEHVRGSNILIRQVDGACSTGLAPLSCLLAPISIVKSKDFGPCSNWPCPSRCEQDLRLGSVHVLSSRKVAKSTFCAGDRGDYHEQEHKVDRLVGLVRRAAVFLGVDVGDSDRDGVEV
nr:hypothetical protein CFP56_34664 [Quercus suber]